MGRIKRSGKPHKGSPAAALIDSIANASDEQLASVLQGHASSWTYPRTDLSHWVDTLNRFDAILEHVIAEYDLAQVQMNAFTPRTKELVISILHFCRTLLDHATNKKLFSSYDRINDLLLTLDLDILEATLALALKPAQLYHRQDPIMDERLVRLSQAWPGASGLKLAHLAADGALPTPPDAAVLEYSFYRRAATKPPQLSAANSKVEDEGLVIITIPLPSSDDDQTRTAVDLLADAVETHNVPIDARLSLFQRIRVALSLARTDDGGRERRQLLLCRFLAIGICAPTTGESTLNSDVLMYDPALVSDLADLVRPEAGVPYALRAAAFVAMDGLAKVRSRSQDINAALGIGVNHGIILDCVRKLVEDLDSDTPASTSDFVDALFNFVSSLQLHHHSASSQLVGAGLIPVLIDIVRIPRKHALPASTRAVNLLDTAGYSAQNATAAFFSAGGITTLVDRLRDVVDEVCSAPKAESMVDNDTDSAVAPLAQTVAQFLKAVMRSVTRLMQTGNPGTAEGLRNLIDSSLPQTIMKILDERERFGSQIFALSITILTTFIHNEPTSLAILQEHKLPDHFYAAIEGGVEPSVDVISAVPNALGALCLNDAGLAQFNEHSAAILKMLFSVLVSERHVRVLADREHASVFGSAIDELIRHHPSVKSSVMSAIQELIASIVTRGEAMDIPETGSHRLVQVSSVATSTASGGGDVEMGDAFASAPAATAAETDPLAASAPTEDKQESSFLVSIDVVAKFLEGFCQNPTHGKELLKTDALGPLVKIGMLPGLPLNFENSHAMRSYLTMLRVLGEIAPQALLTAIMAQLQPTLDDVKHLWADGLAKEAQLASLLVPASVDEATTANQAFSRIVRMQRLIYMLEQVFPHIGYSTSRSVVAQSLALLAGDADGVPFRNLAGFARSCIWESILLSPKPEDAMAAEVTASTEPELTELTRSLADGSNIPPSPTSPTTPRTSSSVASAKDKRKNMALVLSVLRSISTSHSGLLESACPPASLNLTPSVVISRPAPRRQQDATHKKEALQIAGHIARVLVDSLQWPKAGTAMLNFCYAMIMLKSASQMLFLERHVASTQSTLIINFDKLGGTQAVLDLQERFVELANQSLSESGGPDLVLDMLKRANAKGEREVSMIQAVAGLRVCLSLFEKLSSKSAMPDLTAALRTEAGSKDAVDPAAYLVEMRAKILPAVESVWRAPYLRSLPPIVVRSVFRTLLNIFSADAETSADWSASVGAGDNAPLVRRAGQPYLGVPAARPPFVLNEERVRSLVDMGFPRSAAVRALTRYGNETNSATEWLINRPDVVEQCRMQDAADAARSGAGTPAPPAQAADAPPAAAVEEPATTDAIVPDPPAGPVPDGPAPPSASSAEPATVASPAPPSPVPSAGPSEHKIKLDAARVNLKADFLERALELIATYPQLVFDVRNACRSAVFGGFEGEQKGLELVLDKLAERDATAAVSDTGLENAATSEMRLLALLVSEPSSSTSDPVRIRSLASTWLEAALAQDKALRWIAPLLLILEAVFELADAPKSALPIGEGTELKPPALEAIVRGPLMLDERKQAFDLCLRLLRLPDIDADLFSSIMRVLLVATRSRELAQAFLANDGIPLLLSLNARKAVPEGTQDTSVIIIRHVIESATDSTTQGVIEAAIFDALSKSRNRQLDVPTFLAQVQSSAMRDPLAFLRAVASTCKFAGAEHSLGSRLITLQKPPPGPTPRDGVLAAAAGVTVAEPAQPPPSKDEPGAMQVDDAAKTEANEQALASVETPPTEVEHVVHLLMSTLQQAVRDAKAAAANMPASIATSSGDAAATSTTDVALAPATNAPATPESTATVPPEDPATPHLRHARFVMSCLVELLSGYMACKTSFVRFSRSKPKESETGVSGPKSRASFLSLVFNELLAIEALDAAVQAAEQPKPNEPAQQPKASKRLRIGEYASLLVTALCSDVSPSASSDAPSKELTVVRKHVLDVLGKAFKDATSLVEPTQIRYARISALSDLAHRLIIGSQDPRRGGVPHPRLQTGRDDMQIQMAKLMLEKNFAVTFTNTLAAIDLNFPGVKEVINKVLKPLQHLSRVVTKVGRSTSTRRNGAPSAAQAFLAAASAMGLVDDEASDLDDSGADDDDERMDRHIQQALDAEAMDEDDPYRSSALGMHTGHLEAGGAVPEDYDDDDDMDDDDEVMDMMDVDPDAGLVPSDLSSQEGDDAQGFRDPDDHDDIESEDGDDDGDDDDDDDGMPDDEDDGFRDEEDGFDDEDGEVVLDMPRVADIGGLLDAALHEAGLEPGQLPADMLDDADEDEDVLPLPGGGVAEDGFELPAAIPTYDMAPPPEDEDGSGESGTDEDGYDHDEEDDMGGMHDDELLDFAQPPHDIYFPDADPPSRRGEPPRPWLDATRTARAGPANGLNIIQPGNTGAMRELGPHPLLVDQQPDEPHRRQPTALERRRQRHPWQMSGVGREQMTAEIFERIMAGAMAAGGPGGQPNTLAALESLLGNLPGLLGGNARIDIEVRDPHGGAQHINVVDGGERPRVDRFGGPDGFGGGRNDLRMRGFADVAAGAQPAPTPAATLVRWDQEARLTQGAVPIAHRLDVFNGHVVNVLTPAARKTYNDAQEASKKRAEDAARKAVAEAAEAEKKRKTEEETAAAKQAEAEAVDTEMADATPAAPVPAPSDDPLEQVMALARAFGAGAQPTPSTSGPAAPVPSGSSAPAEPAPAPAAAAPAERVTVMVNGSEVDITDTGIDKDFIEALPDDMREEIINQHFREQRRGLRAAGSRAIPAAALPTGISSDFLDALPPEIRAEVLAAERAEEAVRAGRAAGDDDDGPGVPIDMDPASFFATIMDPELRQNVLMEQMGQPGFLDNLPPQLMQEVEAINERRRALRAHGGSTARRQASVPTDGRAPGTVDASSSKPPPREPVQLLDKAGVATLVRLLFFPQALDRMALQTILGNLCDHAKTRLELLTLLLSILQDGTRDAGAVDRTFSQMSIRAAKSTSTRVPAKRRAADTPSASMIGPSFALGLGDTAPNLILQRCLDALQHLVAANQDTSAFFLAEQESLAGSSAAQKRSSKKAKGKEKASNAVPASANKDAVLPLVVLLNLLERPGLQKTPAMMDALTSLLSTVTRPLSVLGKPAPAATKPDEAPKPIDAPDGGEASPAPPSAEAATLVVPSASRTGASTPALDESTPAVRIVREKPPDVPERSLRLVVASLDGECSSRTFQHTLSLIQHFSFLPGARDLISQELVTRAQQYGASILPDLAEMAAALEKAPDEGTKAVPSALMAKFTPSTSTQVRLLRVLKTLDFMHNRRHKSTQGAGSNGNGHPGSAAARLERLRQETSPW